MSRGASEKRKTIRLTLRRQRMLLLGLVFCFTARNFFINNTLPLSLFSLSNTRSLKVATSPHDSASACLLIRDENHQLIEWLAYHYQFLPLRYLVVAVDPTSFTSPEKILERWKDRINITMWRDRDFYDGPSLSGMHMLEQRQRRFYRRCAIYHKEHNRTWVLFTDVDEYLTFNHIQTTDPEYTNTSVQVHIAKKKKPQLYTKYVEEGIALTEEQLEAQRPDMWQKRQLRLKERQEQLQSYSLKNSMHTMIKVANSDPWRNDTCLMSPRLLFSAHRSPDNVTSKARVFKYGLFARKFRTLKYFHHDGIASQKWWGKCFVDVSRTPLEELNVLPNTVHSVFPACGWPAPRYEESPLRVHHYLGSYEEYSHKKDCRRSKQLFRTQSKKVGALYDMQPWLETFIKTVGPDEAKVLLDGVGVLEPLPTNRKACIRTQAGAKVAA